MTEMTATVRTKHDSFAKRALEFLLRPYGHVDVQTQIDAAPQFADLSFSPQHPFGPGFHLLFEALFSNSCLIEIYRNTPGSNHVRNDLEKALTFSRSEGAQNVPVWILSPGRPNTALADFGFRPDTEFVTSGVYRVMSRDVRERYDLEGLWNDAHVVEPARVAE